jgi:hypothetical protein
MQTLQSLFIIACFLTVVVIALTVYMSVTWSRKPKEVKTPFVVDNMLDYDMKEGFLGVSNNIPALLDELQNPKQ